MQREDIDAIIDIFSSRCAVARSSGLPQTSHVARPIGAAAAVSPVGCTVRLLHALHSRHRQHWTDQSVRHQPVALIPEIDGSVVRTTGLISHDSRKCHAAHLEIVFHAEHQSDAHSTLLMPTRPDMPANWLGLLRVRLELQADNSPAIAPYHKHGFEIDGHHHQKMVLRAGRFVDICTMARLREAPAQ
ncbi:MAG: hypothetical protein NVS2B7_35800 [Herpetosiphon sp.]